MYRTENVTLRMMFVRDRNSHIGIESDSKPADQIRRNRRNRNKVREEKE